MSIEYQIIIAVGLDLLIGDPRWFPHPVKWIGRFAMFLEAPARKICRNQRLAGAVTALLVLGVTAAVSFTLIRCGTFLHPLAGDAIGILLIYTGIAARDLVKHSTDVQRALEVGDQVEAAGRVAMICGRDTDRLDEPATVRAAVESVAENIVDGVTAPLFFAVIGGPVGIMVYKAVNTLDSTFGYKNEAYARFGWTSAKIDDVANFVPARLTALIVPLAALILGLRSRDSARILARDRLKHPSPNAGHTEAAYAGALGVQLGGLSYYGGVPHQKPTLGDPIVTPEGLHIGLANKLMLTTAALTLAVLLAIRFMV